MNAVGVFATTANFFWDMAFTQYSQFFSKRKIWTKNFRISDLDYVFTPGPTKDWDAADKLCRESYNGYLATIPSKDVQDYLMKKAKKQWVTLY